MLWESALEDAEWGLQVLPLKLLTRSSYCFDKTIQSIAKLINFFSR